MIRKNDKLRILPQWQDDGDDQFEWVAEEDESGDRVLIRGVIPDFPIHPTFRLETHMVEVANE